MGVSTKIKVLDEIFNVQRHEGVRIFPVWLLRFLYRFGFVIGWTLLIALFVSKYGIAALPYLFVWVAIFTVIGSIFYSIFLDRFSSEKMIVLSVCLAGLLIFIASKQFYSDPVWFFALMIVSLGVFVTQLKIALERYTEEHFRFLQSERVFPLIESADTVAGILAGIAISFSSFAMEAFKLIYLWLAALFVLIPLLYLTTRNSHSKLRRERIGLITKLKSTFLHDKAAGYIKGLLLIVLLQWLIFNLLEFQYTKAIYQSVSKVVLEAGSGFDNIFIHDLGNLFILFNTSALLIQLFLGSRLIKMLGIFGTIFLHFLVTFLSLLGLTFSFNFITAVLTKNNFTITTVLYNNAYHSSYYMFKEEVREYIRELLDGIVRPAGAIMGTIVIILMQKFLTGKELIFYLNAVLIIFAAVTLYIAFVQKRRAYLLKS